MRHKYKIVFSADVAPIIPEVASLCNSVNNTMSEFGFHEKMVLRANFASAELTTSREMNPDEELTAKETLLNTFKKEHPDWNVAIESFEYVGSTCH